MNEQQLAAIRAALEKISTDWKTFGVGDEYETTGYLKIGNAVLDYLGEDFKSEDVEFIENAPNWIRDLLAENAKLRTVAEAAREVVDAFKTTDTSVKQMLRLNELARALDAPEG